MIYSVELTIGNNTYVYPNGPTLLNYYVYRTQQGTYNFHLGQALAPLVEVQHLGLHHVKIIEDGVTLLDGDVDHHPWGGDWTFRPNGLTIKRSPAQLVALNALPPFGNTGNVVGGVSNAKFVPFFDHADVTMYMPTTGERPDIGMVTDWSALWLLGGSSGPMLATSLAGGSCTMHFLDATTPLNLVLKPSNAYDLPGYQPGFYINKGLRDVSGYEGYGDLWGPQTAHWCDMSYVACVATMDHILLRDLQTAANFVLCSSVNVVNSEGIAVMVGEYRGTAHGLGMMFKAHYATRDAEQNGWFDPAIHLPSSYFKTLLDVSLKWHTEAIAASPYAVRFDTLGAGDGLGFGEWQHEYLMMDLALGVLTGHTDWLPMFLKMLGNVIARTNGTSGYPPAYAAYYFNLKDPITGIIYADWAAVWEGYYASGETNLTSTQYNTLKTDPLNAGVLLGTPGYFDTTHAALIFSDYLEKKGLAPVRATYPDFDIAMQNAERLYRSMGTTGARHAVVLDPNAAPVVLPPFPDPTPPPPGGGTDPTPPPVIAPTYPAPNQSPTSYDFEIKTSNDAVTTLDTCFVAIPNVPATAGALLGSVKGNGKTLVAMNIPLSADWFHQQADTPGGAKVFADNHATGDSIRLYGCAGLTINGLVVWAPVADPNPIPTNPPVTGINMPTSTSIKVGDVKQINLTVSPAGADLTSLTYRAVPTDVVSLTKNSNGVSITALKAGTVQIFADVNGADAIGNPAVVEAECDVTVTLPIILARSLTLTPV